MKEGGRICQQITIENHGAAPLSGFAIQYNKNAFGVAPESPMALGSVMPAQLAPGQSHTGTLPLGTGGQLSDTGANVQMALKNNVKVYYFQDALDVSLFLSADGRLERPAFLEQWKSMQGEQRGDVAGLSPSAENVESVCPKFEAASIFFVARRKLPDGADMVYLSAKTANNIVMLVEVGFRPGSGGASIAIKAAQPQYVPMLIESISKILRAS